MDDHDYEVLSESDGYRVIEEARRYEDCRFIRRARRSIRSFVYRIQSRQDGVWETEVRVEVRDPNTKHDPSVRIFIGDDRYHSGSTRDHAVVLLLSDLLRDISATTEHAEAV